MSDQRLYKVLDFNGKPLHGGKGRWALPHDGEAADWMPPLANLVLCDHGYHLCRRQDLVYWLGPVIWEAEARGARIDGDDKIVVSEARLLHRMEWWTDRAARLFACDCGERALGRIATPDPRSLAAVAIARRYAEGQAGDEELAAARIAADAARVAATAARVAADDAWVTATAARIAADDAGITADDARAAERAWQTDRLFEYLDGERG